jgi:hypothetical protein
MPSEGVRCEDKALETLNCTGIAARNARPGLRWTGMHVCSTCWAKISGLEHYEDYATNIEYPTQTESHEVNPELAAGPSEPDESGRCRTAGNDAQRMHPHGSDECGHHRR